MDFPAFSAMPFQAVLTNDLRSMIRSWLVRIWLILIAAQSLFMIAVSLDEETTVAETLAGYLGLFPLVWSTVVIIVSGGAVSSESGVVADSILSKAITRTEYVAAKLTSRLMVVLGAFLAATVPVSYIITENATGPLDNAGLRWAFILVGLMLTLLTCLSVAFSALFNRTMVAIVLVWFAWYIAGSVTALFNADYLSPLAIIDNLPTLIEGHYDTDELLRTVVGFGGLAIGAMLATIYHFGHKDL